MMLLHYPFSMEIYDNGPNVLEGNRSANKTGNRHQSVVKDVEVHHHYINHLTFSYFHEDGYAGMGDNFHSEFENSDGMILNLNVS